MLGTANKRAVSEHGKQYPVNMEQGNPFLTTTNSDNLYSGPFL
jgi:hypothetical protein